MFKKIKAFSLAELSIVLVIISIALGTILNISASKTDADKIWETKEKIAVVEKALSAFLIDNGSIPCPADGSLATTDLNFGIARRGATGNNCIGNFTSGSVTQGIIPIRTLNLDDTFAIDAWGRRFSYAIVEDCNCSEADGAMFTQCLTRNFNTDFCGVTSGINIQATSPGAPYVTNAVVVIISHGKNGHGAFSNNGGNGRIISKLGGINADEQENAHLLMDGTNQPFNANYVSRNQAITEDFNTNYDDIVYFKNKMQLINLTKGLLTGSDYICSIISSAGFANTQCGDRTTNNCAIFMNGMINALRCYR